MRRKLPFLLTCVLVILGTVFCLVVRNPSHSKVDAFYERYCKDMSAVAVYFSAMEYDSISVESGSGTYTVRTVAPDGLTIQSQNFTIEDDAVKSSVRRLFRGDRCKSIHKSGDTVIFLRWVFMMDFGSGFAYVADGDAYADIQYLTKLKPMADPCWYYYEEDYNEWRVQNT